MTRKSKNPVYADSEDWRGFIKSASYNGWAKVSNIQGNEVELLGLFGSLGNGWIAHPFCRPVEYCLEKRVENPPLGEAVYLDYEEIFGWGYNEDTP